MSQKTPDQLDLHQWEIDHVDLTSLATRWTALPVTPSALESVEVKCLHAWSTAVGAFGEIE